MLVEEGDIDGEFQHSPIETEHEDEGGGIKIEESTLGDFFRNEV